MRRRAILERMHGKTNQSHQFFLNFLAELSSIGLNSDHSQANPLHQPEENTIFAQKLPLISLLVIGSLGAWEPSASQVPLPAPPPTESTCGPDGSLQASLFGSIETSLDWSTDDMECESMERPNGAGIRFRFAGDAAGERLAIIIAVPGLEPEETGVELPSKVTATVEGSGRFFTTPNLESCWTEIRSQTVLPDLDGASAVDGVLYCIAPLGEVNGDAAVSIPELSFSALVEWSNQ